MSRILIVDDSAVMRKNLSSILTNGGHEVVGQADNGRLAVIAYSQLKPDLVTMDISMPIMSGVDAVSHIINKDPNAKIVMVSALNQKQMILQALNNGAKHYIIKPIDPSKVLSIVNEVLEAKNEPAKKSVEKEDAAIEVAPGFSIENVAGKFIVLFNENLGIKDHVALDTAMKGLLFIKPLYITFDFGTLEDLSYEVLQPILKLADHIIHSGGNLEYEIKSEKIKSKMEG